VKGTEFRVVDLVQGWGFKEGLGVHRELLVVHIAVAVSVDGLVQHVRHLPGIGFKVQGLGFKVQGLGFKV